MSAKVKKLYQQTIAAYDNLGKQYLQSSYRGVSQVRPDFIDALNPGSKILDLGCGGGRDAKVFIEAGHQVEGIDLSKVLIREAQNLVPQARFQVGDVSKLSFPKDSFDAIWAEAILLHLERSDVVKVLPKLYQVLKPGGLIHVSVKKGRGEALIKEKLSGYQERFYTFFSKRELTEMFRQAGFKIIYSRLLEDPHKRKGMKWVNIWATKK